MLTYQNDPNVKKMFQARFAAHRAADEVIKGIGFDGTRGCFIGCTMDEYSHDSFAQQIGPAWLARLADEIFEGLPLAESSQFGTDLLAAIPVGRNIDGVKWLLAIARHERQIVRLNGNTEPYAVQCRAALQSVIDYCRGRAEGIYKDDDSESAAESAALLARSAALSAAESAALSARSAALSESALSALSALLAESAARSAALSAESAAESARSARSARSVALSARSAARSVWSARSAVWWSAAQNEWTIERDTLLNLLTDFV